MKKALAIILAILMTLSAFPAISLAQEEKPSKTSATNSPSAHTLVGEPHLPPVGNQGAVGCCSAMSTTYMQFTNAISRYLHSFYPEIDWNPSSGSKKYIFSPKSVFDYSSGITDFNYNVQQIMGVGTLDHISYAGNDGYYYKDNDQPIRSACKWAVGNDMFAALNYRLTNYNNVQTKCKTPEAFRSEILPAVKEALDGGNTICVGTNIGYWNYADITGYGSYGKEGDRCAFAGMYCSGMYIGSHFISIVGYDDEIECKVGDSVLKGALQIVNSWGEIWGNQGYCWVMYDACAVLSEFDQLNSLTTCTMYLTETDGKISMMPSELVDETGHQTLECKRVGSKIISYHNYYQGGQLKADSAKYFLYTIQDPKTGLYLAYNKDNNDTSLTAAKTSSCYWAFIPYSQKDENGKETGIIAWDGYDSNRYSEDYVGGYYIFAANKDSNITGNNFLDATVDFGNMNRKISITGFSGGSGPEAKVWAIDGNAVDTAAASFTAKLGIMKGRNLSYKRTDLIGNYSYTNWKTDYKLGYDDVYLKVTFTTNDRSSTYFRTLWAEKGSDQFVYQDNSIYSFAQSALIDHDFGEDHYFNYSGVLDGATETVTQYFTFDDKGCTEHPENYDWAFQIGVANERTAVLKEAKLVSGSNAAVIFDFLGGESFTQVSEKTNKAYTPTWSEKFVATGDQLTMPTKHEIRADLPSGLKLSSHMKTLLNEGERFTFDILTADGKLPGEDIKAVYVNGNAIQKSGGVYTVRIEEDTVITAEYEKSYVLGDLNQDGILSIVDVTVLLNQIAAGQNDPAGDITGEGIVAINDVTMLLQLIAKS